MTADVARQLFTIDDYHRMGEAGILSAEDRVELLGGEVIRMSRIGSPHASCVDRLNALFSRRVGSRVIVRVQNPVILDRFSEPQPDLALLRPRADLYATQHPLPADILLAVEVLSSSDAYDRTLKLPLYARAGVREVWLVDLERGVVETYQHPSQRGYRERQEYRRGKRIALSGAIRATVRVNEILG